MDRMLLRLAASCVCCAFIWCASNDVSGGSGPQTCSVNVHLQSYFDRDFVEVYVDGGLIFGDTVTTVPSIGRAGGTSVLVATGPHQLRIAVNRSLSRDTTLSVADSVWVGVGLKGGTAISLLVSNTPFLYL